MSRAASDQYKDIQNKKLQDIINRFEYYATSVSHSFQQGTAPRNIQRFSHIQTDIANHQYHHLKQSRDPYSHQSYLTKSLLTRVAKQAFLSIKTNLHEKVRFKMNIHLQTQASEFSSTSDLVDVVVMEPKDPSDGQSSSRSCKKYYVGGCNKQIADCVTASKFDIFVIHFPRQNSPWSYFVQKISLRHNSLSQQGTSRPIQYEAIVSFPKLSWFHQNILKYFDQPQLKQLIELSKDIEARITLFQSSLAKTLSQVVNSELEEEKHCHPEFKRESALPASEYKKFEKIKAQVYQYYRSIHKDKRLNRYFLDNLVCRYLIVKKYDEAESLKAIKKYLNWEKQMRSKYTFESFNHLHSLKIFEYIGKDYEGRPIMFFRSTKFKPEYIDNVKEYLDYNSYMFEILLQDHMEGYIDEYILIADYNDFGTQNFKYQIAKEFSEIADEYFPERQHKLILFGVGSFGEWIYKLLKPVLPKFIIDKIFIFGSDKEKIREFLMKMMDIRLLPREVLDQGSTQEEEPADKKKLVRE